MSNVPDNLDPASWHRFFAIECNNRAWELVEKTDRSSAEEREMLDLAHASTFHWAKVGTELNSMRAQSLLSEVHAILGFGESAIRFSGPAKDYSLNRDTDDWEIAFAYAIHAHSCYAAGLTDEHEENYKAAKKAIAAIQATADREIVLRTFNQVPEPG